MKSFLVFLMSATSLITSAQPMTQAVKPLTLNDMAATLRVQPQANGGSLQRILLPADFIMHSQSADLTDLRLFTLSGTPVPFALRSSETESSAIRVIKVTLNALPIRDSGKTVTTGNTSVRLESRGDEVKVFIDRPAGNTMPGAATRAKGSNGTNGTNGTSGTTGTTGVLLDTRLAEGVMTSIELDIDLPPNQIVPITVEASGNLSNWETIAHARSVYRFGDANVDAPTQTSIDLAGGVEIKNRYVRITWPPQPNTNSIAIRGATLSMESSRRVAIAPPRRLLAAPAVATTHSQEWLLGSPLRIRSLVLATTQTGTLLPITVLGRDSDKQPWRRLAGTVLFKLDLLDAQSGQPTASTNAPLALGRVSVRQLKIEALPGSAGIAQNLITAAIEYDAQEIIAAVKADEELIVGVGAVNAQDMALPLPTIVPNANAQRISALATVAMNEAVGFYPARLEASGASLPAARKDFILWGALLLGVSVLAAMAWGAVKQLRAAKR